MSESITELHLLQNGQQVGPFSPDAVRAMIAAGTVTPDDLAWSPGLPEWVPLSALVPDAVPPEVPSVGGLRSATLAAPPSQTPFFTQLLASIAYPFYDDGLIILLAGTLFFTVLGFMRAFAGLLSIIPAVISVGYLFATLQGVILSTAHGENKLPKWPDFSDFYSDIIDPFFKWIGTLALCFAPAMVALFVTGARAAMRDGGLPGAEVLILPGTLLVAGLIYFPMALLAVAMFDSLSALNPILIVRSMMVAPVHYFGSAVFLGGLLAANWYISVVAGRIQVPFVGELLSGFVSLYASLLLARVLGVFYRTNKRRLGWF